MATVKRVDRAWRSVPTIEGAGVRLRRALGNRDALNLDPFLLLDDFHSSNPADYTAGFPWHPHRGIETITYVLRGKIEHQDSMGNAGTIARGDLQWMTAGSGILHQEMPVVAGGEDGTVLQGFQLWANLPRSHKMMPPRYRDVAAADVPVVRAGGATVRVIAGVVDGTRGPVQDIVTDPEYLDVTIDPGKDFTRAVPGDHVVFAYTIGGEAAFDDGPAAGWIDRAGAGYMDVDDGQGHAIGKETLVTWGPGDTVHVTAAGAGTRFLLVSGRPIGEPVAWRGPIVMNTREELEEAFDDLRRGTFIKHPVVR